MKKTLRKAAASAMAACLAVTCVPAYAFAEGEPEATANPETEAAADAAEEVTPAAQKPKAPGKVKVKKVASHSAIVTWKAADTSKTLCYQVRISRNANMKKAAAKTVSGKTASYTFKKLRAATAYYVQVRAKVKKDATQEPADPDQMEIMSLPEATWTPWSAVKTVRTKELGRKELLEVANMSTSSNKLKTFNTDYKLSASKAGKKLSTQVEKLSKSHKVSIVMIDLKTGQGLSCGSTRYMYSASCLKGPYVAALNKYRPSSVKNRYGTQRETIVVSNNDTYKSLRNIYGSGPMASFMSYSDVKGFSSSARYTWVTPRDLTKLWVGCYWYFYKDTNANSERCRNLYTHGNEAFIYTALKGKRAVNTKPGWYPPGRICARNDAGIVKAKVNGKSHPYLLCVMSTAYSNVGSLREIVRSADAVPTEMVK